MSQPAGGKKHPSQPTVALGHAMGCRPRGLNQSNKSGASNGLLRQYFPKSTDLSVHNTEHLGAVAAQLNTRPRKTLDWDNPAQALARLLSTPTTTDGVATTR